MLENHMLTEGAHAPGFTLPGSDGEELTEYDLSTFTDAGATVLVFYPFDFSPVCTSELCEFRDAEWLTLTPDVDVLGISTDSAYAHRRFIQANDINFPLLSDAGAEVIDAYGVRYDEWDGHRKVAKRAVTILDADQRIQYHWETENARENPNLSDVYSAINGIPSVSLVENPQSSD